ncbi:class IV adenylate cyclase [Candidatus Woesearchaeota archaeon CG10_big_fil_rev_8_21_14_0_10_32_9]|nr:MAG: class IV adenylate cyclase [Candidatus Woesearchaeota archaeon CG10_big_fil_rev_8_21_14_0_10_32_9]
MNQEFETKVLNINKKEVEKKLKNLGAKKLSSSLMRRWVFDWLDEDLESDYGWIRLRQEGKKVTLTYKNRRAMSKSDTKELETEVNNFDMTAEILQKIPFKRKFYQENKRTVYVFEDVEFMIDEWPGLKPHLEIEGKTKEALTKGITLLEFTGKDSGDISVNKIYKDELNVDLHKIERLSFDFFKEDKA